MIIVVVVLGILSLAIPGAILFISAKSYTDLTDKARESCIKLVNKDQEEINTLIVEYQKETNSIQQEIILHPDQATENTKKIQDIYANIEDLNKKALEISNRCKSK